ncbi:hypothetical protein O181_019938 [Austropuccinia psidii MF-1]|uniref:Uncharacterized protein n=1 Tax=Austropuccinia psidii MF-1 TaxID=1389203 RepID=A0A9Q3CC05_9BASI|nr:hypothetical protein [Austropuccinia psidii MF-1]
MSHVYLRDLGLQRNQPEDREGLSRTRRPVRGHLGHSGGWQNNEGDHINAAIHTPIHCQKICLKEIDFEDLMVITKGWNPTRQFRLLEARAQRIREKQATIQAIEDQLTQTGPTQIPSGSQGAGKISPPVASHHSETNKSMTKSHHSSQFQEVSRRRKGYKGKNKTSFSQRQKDSDPMIQKLLDLVKEVHKNQK